MYLAVSEGIDQSQGSRPDEDGRDNPSIEAWYGIEPVRAIDAFSALLGKETKKKTVLRTFSEKDKESDAEGGSQQTLTTGSEFLLGNTPRLRHKTRTN
jgi:hypothetical protein